MAADLEPPASAYDWSGIYVGGHVGYGFLDVDGVHDGSPVAAVPEPLGALDIDGVVGGAQIGYQRHLENNLVLGIEADISFGDHDDTVSDGFAPPVNDTVDADVDFFGSIRFRVGYAQDRFLPFITGGFAYAETELTVNDFNGGAPLTGSDDFTQLGGVIGGGIEYALFDHVRIRAEYLHYLVSERNVLAFPPFPDSSPGDFVRFDDFGVVRFGVNIALNPLLSGNGF